MRYRPNPRTEKVNSGGITAFGNGNQTGREGSGNCGNYRTAAVEEVGGKGWVRQTERDLQ